MNNQTTNDVFLNIGMVAKRLGISKPTVKKMILNRELPALYICGRWKVSENDLAEFIIYAKRAGR